MGQVLELKESVLDNIVRELRDCVNGERHLLSPSAPHRHLLNPWHHFNSSSICGTFDNLLSALSHAQPCHAASIDAVSVNGR